ncbi:MAG: glycerate kinase [Atopobiaceae bacterium]|jgi:glycerate kinase|nr:glycerate kinase [Atopobiaceae bacterium]MCH4120525.1 glycerate kinase [Atopobiaceae bacterium]MCI1318318.1 glycerate kinase [Atopobiaceae bacterium]MCI1388227.1 glycerate kinase [Atopobiaceae bacterium]MCI1431523.1 glycerate kinase [Atopobiaceae bacterium]
MRVLVASDSFKGTLTSREVADVVARGLADVMPDASCERLYVGDGGEGTLDAVAASCEGELRHATVCGPLGEPVDAAFAILPGGRAYIESAAACGLPLVPAGRRDPLHATTAGVGELVEAALSAGCREIVVGLGGSATNDAGAGMARALGVRLLDEHGRELEGLPCELARVREVDLSGMDPRLAGCEVRAMCDVTNPLTGPEGATYVYGPQKGLRASELAATDEALRSYAACVARALGRDEAATPGAGAAGGLGFSLRAFAHASLAPGIECVLDLVGFDDAARGCDLVVTGEGHLDEQTRRGKVVAGVAARSAALGVPCVAIVGGASAKAELEGLDGLSAVVSCVTEPLSEEEALAHPEEGLLRASCRLFSLLALGRRLA